SPSAGGLIVASSVYHAQTIKKILCEKFSQTVSIVTYRHEEPLDEIERYRRGKTQWIVSVGMISEGTDIPRLQVCCHMSSVKTELYFRQVLGRILRVNDSMNQQAWLFTFAEQSLIEFAERVEQDIPDSCMFARMLKHVELESNYLGHNSNEGSILSEQEELSTKILWSNKTKSNTDPAYSLSTFDELLLGTFKQRVLSAFFSEN
ncbi:DEAD/DEAH box helicase, partial [Vibrio splendidus]